MFKKNTISRTIMALALGAILVGQPVLLGKAFAAPGDFTTVDLTAAAPLTYDHATGGGAYDQRDVGRALDIVESLEGGDLCAVILQRFSRESLSSKGLSMARRPSC